MLFRRPALIAASILCVAVALAWVSSRGDTVIVDEVPHIGAGYSYVARLDYRLNPEHPPLVKTLAGLMLTPLELNQQAFLFTSWTKDVNGQWNFGRRLIFESGNDADLIKDLARIPAILIFVVGGWLVWRWTNERSGKRAGLMAVILYAFSPTLLAHGRFVTTDVAAAVGCLAALYCFTNYIRDPSRTWFALSALTLGLALLAKFNTVLLGPLFLVIAICYGGRRHWFLWARRTALIGIAAVLLVVYPVYIVHTLDYPAKRQIADTQHLLGSQPGNPLKSFVLWGTNHAVTRPLVHWMFGLSLAIQRAEGDNTIFWLGRVVQTGGPLYFPLVYALKEPIPWLLLCALAIATVRYRRHTRKHRQSAHPWHAHLEERSWLLWIAIYWAVSIQSSLNIGVRHLLPIYPFAIMLVAGEITTFAQWLRHRDPKRARQIGVTMAILLGWYVFESVSVFPYYLTYFNQLAGGPAGGHRYVADSNLDWGQDAKRLGQWAQAKGVQKICFDYFGWASPEYYLGTRYVWTSSNQWASRADFVARNQCNGWIAISASFLQSSVGQKTTSPDIDRGTYRWILNDEPVTIIGNSLYVWQIK